MSDCVVNLKKWVEKDIKEGNHIYTELMVFSLQKEWF